MIPITYMRSSSYNCHDFCPMRYFAEYGLGWFGPSNKKADKGTIVHKVLELLANAKKAQQCGENEFYDEEVDITLSSDVGGLVIDLIIEHTYEYYKKAFTQHNWTNYDFSDCRKWTYKAFDLGLDPRNMTIVDAEPRFDFEVPEPWAAYKYTYAGKEVSGRLKLKGTIDLIRKQDSGRYEIIDWKTGRRFNWATGEEKTYAKLCNDAQLLLYYYAASQLYPDIEDIDVTIVFINDGGAFTIPVGREQIPDILEMLRGKFELIKNCKRPKLKRSWKCGKFCHQGTTTFENTSVLPLIEQRPGQVTPLGENMTKCEQLKYTLEHRPIESVLEHMIAPGFDPTHYKAPGSTE